MGAHEAMTQPTLFEAEFTKDSPVFFVDIPKDLDSLLLCIYEQAKDMDFPLQVVMMGKKVTFGSMTEIVGYAKGVHQTSALFEADSIFS